MDLKSLLGDSYKEGMSIDEINDALSGKELIDKNALDGFVPKKKADDAAHDAAEWKRKYQATLTEAEQAKIARDEQDALIQKQLSEYKRQIEINENTKRYMGLGYSEELATSTASALADGDMAKVFRNAKKYIDDREAAIRNELLNKVPKPPVGVDGGEKKMTREDFRKLSISEKQKLATEDPDLYKSMTL